VPLEFVVVFVLLEEFEVEELDGWSVEVSVVF
jgi:hypothetical protein